MTRASVGSSAADVLGTAPRVYVHAHVESSSSNSVNAW